MSTAEITFSVGELASERRQDARKILWAVLAALVIHVIIGFVLAIVSAVQPLPEVEEDKPVELTIVDASQFTPVKPKNSEFVETDPSRQSAEPPKEKTFESNANSIGASEAAPSGEMPLPSQQGKDRPDLELDNQSYTLANQGAQPQTASAPQPSVAPQPSTAPQPTITPVQATTPAPTTAPDQFAMLTRTPTPPPQVATPAPASQPATAPPQPNSAYRPERQKTRIGGNISNRGISSVNALGTPLGRYQKFLFDSIGSRWYPAVERDMGLYGIGTVTLSFRVDRNGKIQNLKVLSKSSGEAFVNVCLASVLQTQVPPMSDDLASSLPPEGLEVEIPFTIFPN